MPSILSVSLGQTQEEMVEQEKIHSRRTARYVTLLDHQHTYYRYIRIHVWQCHELGVQCRVGGLVFTSAALLPVTDLFCYRLPIYFVTGYRFILASSAALPSKNAVDLNEHNFVACQKR